MRRPMGAVILPRRVADRGQLLWPKCARCMRAVDAYGIENETDASIEIWVRCDGMRIDPRTGQAVHGAMRRHASMRSSVTILKGVGWSPQRFTEIVSKTALFHPEGDRVFLQLPSAQTVRRT